jgi:heptosyltransferase-2
MLRPIARALYGLPFPGSIPEHLQAEFEAWPAARRRQLVRKLVQREALMVLTGQAKRRCANAPAATRRMLWHYTWTTVGDAIMDLAARTLVPPGIEIDLLISPVLAPLFERDARFARVCTDPGQCQGGYDFLLLHHLSTEALAAKRRHFPQLPFASVIEHRPGEMFARLEYGDRRVRQLFGLPPGPTAPPSLALQPLPTLDRGRFHLAVALGARDERRRFPFWRETLSAMLARWPAGALPLTLHWIGSANARPDVATLDRAELRDRSVNHVEQLSLLDAARLIATCDGFIGTDGGLMHVAVATHRPGAALFSAVPPRYRLLPDASVAGLDAGAAMRAVAPDALAQAAIDRVRPVGAAAHPGHAQHGQA